MKKIAVVAILTLLVGLLTIWRHFETEKSSEQINPIFSHKDTLEARSEVQEVKESMPHSAINKDLAFSSHELPNTQKLSTEAIAKPMEINLDITEKPEQKNKKLEDEVVITDEQAKTIACKAVGNIETSDLDKICVERFEGRIRVIFPFEELSGTIHKYENEVVIDSQTGEISAAWKFFQSNDAVENPNIDKMISAEQAIEIAKKEIDGIASYNKLLKVRVEYLRSGVIRVTFPINLWHSPTGGFVRGASYAAEVLIDAKSGQVLKTLGGS